MTVATGRRVLPEEDAAWDDWLAHATAEQLACRDARHAWDDATVNLDRKNRTYEVVEECNRKCGTRRTRWVSSIDGQPVGAPVYDYEDGFLAKGSGAFGSEHRGQARLARMQHLHANGHRRGR